MANFIDVIKYNAANASGVPVIDEVSRRHPMISRGDWRTIKGNNYKTVVQTGASNTTGSFRSLNVGTAPATVNKENRLVSTFPIQPRYHVDAQEADNSEDGAAAFIAKEVSAVLETEFQAHEKQMVYGAASGVANALGYPGFLDAYDATNMVTDAGGTTSSTGSSVWLVRWGPDSVQGVLANGGQFAFGAVQMLPLPDANNAGKFIDTYVQSLRAQVGLQVANQLRIARIKKITADSGHTLTDKLVMDTISLFKQVQPNAIYLSLRSLAQLRDSRTATNPTGTEAPFPTSIVGVDGGMIPIFPTAGISDTESLTL